MQFKPQSTIIVTTNNITLAIESLMCFYNIEYWGVPEQWARTLSRHQEEFKVVTASGEHRGNTSNAFEVSVAHDTIILFLEI